MAETKGDKGFRFSPNILQALRGYNVVVLQRTGPACLSLGPAVIEGSQAAQEGRQELFNGEAYPRKPQGRQPRPGTLTQRSALDRSRP